MTPSTIVHAGEVGVASVVEGVAKVRDSLPENIKEAADRKLGGETTLGKGVLAMVDTVAEESAKARAAVAEEAAKAAAKKAVVEADVATALETVASEESVAALGDAAASASEKSRSPIRKILLGGVVIGATAGGAYFVWKRRKQAANDSLSGVDEWAPPTMPAAEAAAEEAVEEAVSAEAAAEEAIEKAASAEAAAEEAIDEAAAAEGDKSFSAQIDDAANDLAETVVDSIETDDKGQGA